MVNSNLFLALSAAVPLWIAGLKQRGGPSESEWRETREFGPVLGEKGDAIQFGGKKGEAAALFNRLAKALAVMSFVPGGVRFGGERWVSVSMAGEPEPQASE